MRISALDPKIEGNQNFGVNGKGVKGTANFDIAMVHWKRSSRAPLGATQAPSLIKFDARGLKTSLE